MKIVGTIKEIWRFPVKSMFGESVSKARIEPSGMPEDRHWALRDDEAGEITHGKKFPRIMQLRAQYLEEPTRGFDQTADNRVEITFPDGSAINSDDPYASALLSMYLGRRVSLVPRYTSSSSEHYKLARPMTFNETRYVLGMKPDGPMADFSYFPFSMLQTITRYACPPGAYYDVYPLHFMTTASLQHMKTFYPDGDFRAERYRPGFVIETTPELEGFVENEWEGSRLRVGDIVINCGHPTIRCSMPGAEQPGVKKDPLIPRMVQHHAGQNLGLYGATKNTGTIQVGDKVELLPPAMQRTVKYWNGFKRQVKTAVFSASEGIMQKQQDKEHPAPPRYPVGFTPFVLKRRHDETSDISSFYFTKEDGGKLPPFIPGQHVVLALPGRERQDDIYRPYSLSDSASNNETFRITVKRESCEIDGGQVNGKGSEYLHDLLQTGDTVYIKGPGGHFGELPGNDKPLVLICSGVGVTPFLSMIKTLADENPARSVHLFYGVRSDRNLAFADELAACTKRMPNLKIHLFLSQQIGEANLSGLSGTTERISAEQICQMLPAFANYKYFVCGSSEFTSSMVEKLIAQGVASNAIHFESFAQKRSVTGVNRSAKSWNIEFLRSQVKRDWNWEQENLLEFAENSGVPAVSGCRYGACQACAVTLVSGQVSYPDDIEKPSGKGKILLCSAVPDSDLVIDM